MDAMNLSGSREQDDALFDTARDEPCPGIHVQIDTEQVNSAGGMGRTDKHCRLSGVIQVACPLVEHHHVHQFGDVLFELRRCLCLIRAEDEGRGFAAIVGIDQQIVAQDE